MKIVLIVVSVLQLISAKLYPIEIKYTLLVSE